MVDMNDARQAAEVGAAMYGTGKAAGSAAVKYTAGGLLFAAISSASVVMTITMPTSKRDFFAAIMSTVISSVCGGAYVSTKIGLVDSLLKATTEAEAMFAIGSIIGVAFVCGLPAWAVVRSLFIWTESRKKQGLDQLIKDAREVIR